jgi:hypothetical protein
MVPDFSNPTDREALAAASDHDPTLAYARGVAGTAARITQALAGGPLLIDTYQLLADSDDLLECAAAAILTAAIDLHRAGYTDATSAEMLVEAAGSHMTGPDRAQPQGWQIRALAIAASRHHGVRALSPTTPGVVGPATHYDLHDYFTQWGIHHRRYDDITARTWRTITEQPLNSIEAIARAALNRGNYSIARTLISKATGDPRIDWSPYINDTRALLVLADTGNKLAANRLADIAAEKGDLNELMRLADVGNQRAANRLADLAVGRRDLNELRRLAASGNERAADQLALEGDLEDVQRLARAGNQRAADRLVDMAAERVDLEELHHLVLK